MDCSRSAGPTSAATQPWPRSKVRADVATAFIAEEPAWKSRSAAARRLVHLSRVGSTGGIARDPPVEPSVHKRRRAAHVRGLVEPAQKVTGSHC
jgi:hypothetical protein